MEEWEIVINNWVEIQEEVFRDSWNPDLGRYRSQCAFRGVPDVKSRLETGLMRLSDNFEILEPHLLRNFRKYAPLDSVEIDSFWHWLSMAQHHGLPTRLLDWTFSPMVAMHFATSRIEDYDIDGVIWSVNYVETHKSLPEKFKKIAEEEGSLVFTLEMLTEAVDSFKALQKLKDEEPDFVLFLEPPSIDARIVNQYAMFSVMPDPTTFLDDWLKEKFKDNPKLFRRIIIPSDVKPEIRDKLDRSNITERVIFPGLDGLSSWLRRHYSSFSSKKKTK
ncbi:MAG: FRG domain-containing protein [Candidatus Hermodarchaeota archaeon]